MNETKKFEQLDNGKLRIIVNSKDKLVLPHKGKNVDIGFFSQITEQIIDKDKIHILQAFIDNQKASADGNMNNIEAELVKLKHIDENLIPDKIIKEVTKSMTKGSKALKKQLINLNQMVAQIVKKKQLLQNKDYLEKQLVLINKDHKALKKSLVL